MKPDFLKMTNDEFDQYMVKTYPIQFEQRHLPMTQTCMCWGFNIGKGWYSILDNLCSQCEAVYKQTGIIAIFTQVKEKFGSARFYINIKNQDNKIPDNEVDVWCDIIQNLVSYAERKTVHTCAKCGGYRGDAITDGGWVYDVCGKCFKVLYPNHIKSKELEEPI